MKPMRFSAQVGRINMAEQKVVGMFSVDRRGGLCFHAGECTPEEAEHVRKLLNRFVTGGPHKMLAAVAAPIDGVPVTHETKEDQRG